MINQIGLEHGVHLIQVKQWKKILPEQAKTLFEDKRAPKPVAGTLDGNRSRGTSSKKEE